MLIMVRYVEEYLGVKFVVLVLENNVLQLKWKTIELEILPGSIEQI